MKKKGMSIEQVAETQALALEILEVDGLEGEVLAEAERQMTESLRKPDAVAQFLRISDERVKRQADAARALRERVDAMAREVPDIAAVAAEAERLERCAETGRRRAEWVRERVRASMELHGLMVLRGETYEFARANNPPALEIMAPTEAIPEAYMVREVDRAKLKADLVIADEIKALEVVIEDPVRSEAERNFAIDERLRLYDRAHDRMFVSRVVTGAENAARLTRGWRLVVR